MVDTCAAEFESETPYFYSTYEWENNQSNQNKESIIVLGSGPNSYWGKGLNLTMQLFTQLKLFKQLDMKPSL